MARDSKGRFLKEGQGAFRTYKQDLKDMEKSAGKLDGVYRMLAQRGIEMKNATEETRDNFEEQLDIGKDLVKNKENIFNVDLKNVDLSGKILQAKKDENVEEEILLTSLQKQIAKQKEIQNRGNKQLKQSREKRDSWKSFLEIIPVLGDSLSSALDKAGEVYEEGLGEELADTPKSFTAMKGAAKGAGLAIAAYIGKNLLQSMQGMGAGLMDVLSRPEFIFFGEESRAIADEFGNMNESGMKLGFQMKMMAFFTGVTAENQAKIMGMMAATSDASLETLHSQMKSYKQAGVPFSAIMEDVANNTEFFAKFGKDGGANIFEAAKKAKELGINLGDVASMSDSLLDFESSINKQMEASMLLGREINVDRARQLAFSGDSVGLMEEVTRLAGSEAEFNKMNYLQREAMAGAIGLSVERMSALIRAEEAGNEAAEKQFKSFVGIGAILLGTLGAVLAVIPGFGWAALGKMAVGGGVGAAVGSGIGAAAYGIANRAPELAIGGIVKSPTMATVGERGPEAVVPLPRDGMKVDMAQTNLLLERLIRKVGDMGVSA